MEAVQILVILSLTALLTSQLTAPVAAMPAPGTAVLSREARSLNGGECDTHVHSSCHFYSHCVASVLPCGPYVFGGESSYAKLRCEAIESSRPKLSTSALRWAHSTEHCFKLKLLELVKQQGPNPAHPDPHTCLDLEAQAMELMKTCFVEGSRGTRFDALTEEDVTSLVSLFRVDAAYHNITVDRGLVEVVKTRRSQALATTLLSNHTLDMPYRILLCTQASKFPLGIGANQDEEEPTPEEYVRTVAAEVRESFPTLNNIGTFHYGGPDDVDQLCMTRLRHRELSGLFNTHRSDYHVVSWFTSHRPPTIRKINIFYYQDIHVQGVIFELTRNSTRKQTRCGDGQRQATESCDFADSYPGCSLECELREGYDCSVDRLQPSECWMEECGDGLRTRSEQCDDGNMDGSDGCNSACEVETLTHSCFHDYNKTSECVLLDTVPLQKLPQPSSAKLISQATSHVTARHAPVSSSSSSSAASSHEDVKRTVQPLPLLNNSAGVKSVSTWATISACLLAMSMLR